MSPEDLPRPLSVHVTLESGQRRRLRWEPRTDGRWVHYVDERDGDAWRPVGREIVDDVAIERGEEAVPA